MKPIFKTIRMSLCAVFMLLPVGCSAAQLQAQSSADLGDQDAHLSSALQHLEQAHARLIAQPNPAASAEVDAGAEDVRAAAADSVKVRRDVQNLTTKANNLQHEIDKHHNDLLGPRARRIRNRLIVVMILLSIGAALLRFGPLFGGPVGGAVILVGHVLTAGLVPLWSLVEYGLEAAWSLLVAVFQWIVAKLETLGNANSSTQTVAATNTGSVPHAAAGSD